MFQGTLLQDMCYRRIHRSSLMARLLPAGAVSADGPIGDSEEELLPQERPVIASAGGGRRREFAAGRACAHVVLARLGWSQFPLLSGPSREPLWPPGIAGSITHSEGYVAAAGFRIGDLGPVRGLGIDAEANEILPPEVARLVLTHSERASGARPTTAIFSAKESVYKAWFPLTGRWLDYHDVEIDMDLEAAQFEVRILEPALQLITPRIALAGRVAFTATHVLTVVTAALDQT